MCAALSRLSGLQTVALSIQLQNVHVVREAVEEGTGEPLRSKDARPLLKGQIAGDQRAALLVAVGENLK